MTRAAFNTTVDWIYGPGQVNAGVVHGTGAARFVPRDWIDQVGNDCLIMRGWVTCDSAIPLAGWDSLTGHLDLELGDDVAIPAGGAAWLFVVYVESVSHPGQPFYYRASVAELPRPSGLGCIVPGPWLPPTCVGAPLLAFDRTYSWLLAPGTYWVRLPALGSPVTVYGDINQTTPDFMATLWNGNCPSLTLSGTVAWPTPWEFVTINNLTTYIRFDVYAAMTVVAKFYL